MSTVLGIALIVLGVEIYWDPHLTALGFQMDISEFNRPTGVVLCILGLLWIVTALKKPH